MLLVGIVEVLLVKMVEMVMTTMVILVGGSGFKSSGRSSGACRFVGSAQSTTADKLRPRNQHMELLLL